MILVWMIISVYLLWFFYLAVMNLARAKENGTLTTVALYLGYPIFLVGYLLDIFVQVTVMSLLFLELPKEWTVTGRLKRHLYGSLGWREKIAAWFCHHLLNTFDPNGRHC